MTKGFSKIHPDSEEIGNFQLRNQSGEQHILFIYQSFLMNNYISPLSSSIINQVFSSMRSKFQLKRMSGSRDPGSKRPQSQVSKSSHSHIIYTSKLTHIIITISSHHIYRSYPRSRPTGASRSSSGREFQVPQLNPSGEYN